MNEKKLFESMDGIMDEDLILIGLQRPSSHDAGRSRRIVLSGFLRRAASVAAAAVLIVGAAFAAVKLSSNNREIKKEAVLPPARVPAGIGFAQLSRSYSIPEAYREADGVYIVTVGNWLGEQRFPGFTFYQAHVERTLKGENKEEVVIIQEGTSEKGFSEDCGPFFTYGDKLLVFLAPEETGENVEPPYEHFYNDMHFIKGAYTTVFYIVEDEEGEQYAIDTQGLMSQYDDNDLHDYGSDDDLRAELLASLYRMDPYWTCKSEECVKEQFCYYKLADLVERFSALNE